MQPKTAQCKTTDPHKLDPVPVEVPLGYNEQQPDEPSLSPQNNCNHHRDHAAKSSHWSSTNTIHIDMISQSLNSTRTHVLPPLPLDIITMVICYLSINIDIVYNSDPDLNT